MALELPFLKLHAVFPFIMEGVSGGKTFIFRVHFITLPFVDFQACAIYKQFYVSAVMYKISFRYIAIYTQGSS
jgi:hypothetical protein